MWSILKQIWSSLVPTPRNVFSVTSLLYSVRRENMHIERSKYGWERLGTWEANRFSSGRGVLSRWTEYSVYQSMIQIRPLLNRASDPLLILWRGERIQQIREHYNLSTRFWFINGVTNPTLYCMYTYYINSIKYYAISSNFRKIFLGTFNYNTMFYSGWRIPSI